MKSFEQYMLMEGKEGKNLHLEHLEEEVLNGGVAGTRGAINFLQSLRDMLAGHSPVRKINLTTKWDGSPSVFAGVNPDNGRFFVGTKGVFAANAKLNYTPEDIDRNHPGEGLNKKLKVALRYLPALGIRGVIQGDMMFTREDLKSEKIDGVDYVTFQPNTIVYAVPSDSPLADQLRNAKLGIVWHTSYTGSRFEDMEASFGVDINKLTRTRDVWFRDATFTDVSGTATFTQQETAAISAILAQAGSLFRTISARTLNEIAVNDTYKIQIKAWNNLKVRQGEKITDTVSHVKGLILAAEAKMNVAIGDAKKEEVKQNRSREKTVVMNWYRANKDELKKIFDLQNLLADAKTMIVRKLEQAKGVAGTFLRTDTGLKVTNDEGFVAVDVLKGNAVKLVDRLEFSQANFNVAKQWSK